MEELNKTEETKNEMSNDERLKALADKNGISTDELLNNLEEKQSLLVGQHTVSNQSIGSQNKNAQDIFDPSGTEFLKGVWGN